MKEEYLSHLYKVGKSKSLGYLPLSTLYEICETQCSDVLTYAENNNLGYLLLKPRECNIASGAVYLYHEAMLQEILQTNKECLINAKVPITSSLDFINYISNYFVDNEKFPEAYRIIGLTFADKRFVA